MWKVRRSCCPVARINYRPTFSSNQIRTLNHFVLPLPCMHLPQSTWFVSSSYYYWLRAVMSLHLLPRHQYQYQNVHHHQSPITSFHVILLRMVPPLYASLMHLSRDWVKNVNRTYFNLSYVICKSRARHCLDVMPKKVSCDAWVIIFACMYVHVYVVKIVILYIN